MPSYRLLRSNKESGPYSLNDLLTLGLKPYDLIWVDGRSAAWRYSSEISELKEYAPAVEEQPFDRFFKKPSENVTPEKKPIPDYNPNPQIVNQPKTTNENFEKEEVRETYKDPAEETVKSKKPVPEIPNPSYQSYQPQPKKKVFVSMPETDGFTPYQNSYQEEKYEQYLPKPNPIQQKASQQEERSYSPINIQESEESKVETKYTQSLDDIKEMYINTLVQRKTKNKRKEIIKRYIRPALLPLLLVITGVAIGYFITSKKNSIQASESVSKITPQQTTPQPNIPEQKSEDPIDQNNLQPAEQKNPVSSTDNKNDKIITPQQEKLSQGKAINSREKNQEQRTTQPRKENNNAALVFKTVNPPIKEKATYIPSDETTFTQKKNVEVDPTIGERKSVVRDNNGVVAENNFKSNAESSNKKNSSEHSFLEDEHKNIRDLVSVKSNNYIRGTFGGISGLELTVYNNSNYLIDEVSVELQIMKPSEQPLRTDIITFKNISANGAVTVKVPDSQRGIRVDYRITNVESKQWQKGTAGL
jgi:hypothetical protein